jgi:prephenate dehydrogenase
MRNNRRKIGIIGGKGQMGRFFEQLFEQEGYDVLISDSDTTLTNRELVQQVEIVVISVPINKTVSVIEEIKPVVNPEQLLIDLTSLKCDSREAMLKTKAAVLGLHPMFGPSVSSITNQTIIVIPGRGSHPAQKDILKLFKEQKANLRFLTAEKHDQIMARVQLLAHLLSLCLGLVLEGEQNDLEELLVFSTHSFRIQLALCGRLLNQSAELYSDLFTLNTFKDELVIEFQKSFKTISESILSDDPQAIQKVLMKLRTYFGSLTTKCMEETDYLIEKLAQYDRQE